MKKITWLGLLNALLLQLFFVRLTICRTEYKINRELTLPFYRIAIMYWVWPFTGWDSDYKFVRAKRPKYLYLTRWI